MPGPDRAFWQQRFEQRAAEGRIEGPPYHMDIHAVRALLPEPAWQWSAPPYPAVPHPSGWTELALALRRH
jgi:hypothetical protein